MADNDSIGAGDDTNPGAGDDTTNGGAASVPTVATDALNQQIVQAVDKTNSVVIGAAREEATGIAFQKVAQAAAFAVQDSTDYLRNMMTMAAAAQGVCMQKMVAENTPEQYATIMTDIQAAVTAAQANFAAVGTSASAVVTAFPKD